MMSGPRIDLSQFREGWMKFPLLGAHYVVRGEEMRTLCGVSFQPRWRDHKGFVVFEPGDFPLCKRCEKAEGRRASSTT